MQQAQSPYILDDSLKRIDFATVRKWLDSSYWCPGISLELVERAARGSSLVVGAYLEQTQVGYLRVISDRTTFGYLSDVFVDEAHRGKGLARAMTRFALAHPRHQGFRRWALATKDAHGVYAPLGFTPLPDPTNWMTKVPDGQ